ncbi:hypothetical protein [Vibrio phage RYC]|nr:hypothetical protein [Vibrio phage RYC]
MDVNGIVSVMPLLFVLIVVLVVLKEMFSPKVAPEVQQELELRKHLIKKFVLQTRYEYAKKVMKKSHTLPTPIMPFSVLIMHGFEVPESKEVNRLRAISITDWEKRLKI